MSELTCPCCGHEFLPAPMKPVRLGEVVAYPDTRTVVTPAGERRLARMPFTILARMMQAGEGVRFSTDSLQTLLNQWDHSPNCLQVYICRLRKVLRGALEVRSAYGEGYWLQVPAARSDAAVPAGTA